MKNLSAAFFLAILFFLSCKKKATPCYTATEITDSSHRLDPQPLFGYPGFADTLARYPQLRVYERHTGQDAASMVCKVFYRGLRISTSRYLLSYDKNASPRLVAEGNIPDSLPISLTPSVSAEKAVAIARSALDFGSDCPHYRLAINDTRSTGTIPVYRLVWEVATSSGYPFAVVDAQDGTVLFKDDNAKK